MFNHLLTLKMKKWQLLGTIGNRVSYFCSFSVFFFVSSTSKSVSGCAKENNHNHKNIEQKCAKVMAKQKKKKMIRTMFCELQTEKNNNKGIELNNMINGQRWKWLFIFACILHFIQPARPTSQCELAIKITIYTRVRDLKKKKKKNEHINCRTCQVLKVDIKIGNEICLVIFFLRSIHSFIECFIHIMYVLCLWWRLFK